MRRERDRGTWRKTEKRGKKSTNIKKERRTKKSGLIREENKDS